ncbi:IS3 family transposase [Nonomuraea phyllanthi]|uniref:IS3 family transposase n=1 Tax=Nonomuraea phyllanthi TaxID=2219224 RepID=UPI00186B3E00
MSGHYAWRGRPPSPRAVRHVWLTDLIRQIHQRSRGTYGARRVHTELTLPHQVSVSHGAVELSCAAQGWKASAAGPSGGAQSQTRSLMTWSTGRSHGPSPTSGYPSITRPAMVLWAMIILMGRRLARSASPKST